MSKNFSIFSSPFAFIATLFGIGKLPIAPGTWGSIFGLLTYLYFTIYFSLSLLAVIVITLFISLFSVWVCEKATFYLSREEKDQKSIVLDEFAGIWIACCPAATILMVQEVIVYSLIAFLFFRLFDIWKPYPINVMDAKLKNGFGIVFDDLLAGLYAATSSSLVFYLFVQ